MRLSQISMFALAVSITAVLSIASSADTTSILDSRIYKPDPMPSNPTWADGPPPETLKVTTDDGLELKGYRWSATQANHVTLVFFHGNAGNRFTAAQLAAPLRRGDAEIIIASYRGYGDNPGKPSEQGLFNDGRAFMKAARASKSRRLFVFGFSLGGAVALRMAASEPVDAVVTLGTFSSIRALAPPLLRGMIPNQYDSLSAIKRIDAPTLILHGSADQTIPYKEAERLDEAAGVNATLVRLVDAPHNIALDQVADRIWGFLSPITKK